MKKIKGSGNITENNVFIFPKEKELSSEDIKGFIEYNNGELSKYYTENMKMYRGHYPIEDEEEKPLNKPDNRVSINFAKYIVDIFNGFFIGIPPQITLDKESDNKSLQDFNNNNSFVDKLSEIAKQTSIYSRSYLFLYKNENSETKIAISSPINSFIIYDDTVAQEPLYFVRYSMDENNQVSGTIYGNSIVENFDSSYLLESQKPHLFNGVPAVEFIENEERQGAFDSVKSIMNAINSALSQKANDVEAIADSYLFLNGADLDDDGEMIKNLKDNRLINNPEPTSDAKFLERPNGDGTQENLLNRLEDKLFLTSMVTNLNNLDSGASSSASGYSIELRMQAMRSLASNKERKFTSSLKQLYKMIFNESKIGKQNFVKKVLGVKDDNPATDLKFQFTRNLPKNVDAEANTAKTLEGIVSKESQLQVLSFIDNPKDEIKKIEDEENQSIKNSVENNPANYDFQKQENKDGVENDNSK